MLNNRENLKKYKVMDYDQRLEFMATANRVTIARVTQVKDRSLQHRFAAKVRGIIISNEDKYLFLTPEAARGFGRRALAGWKREFEEQAK